jgi:hypothetical protein
VDETKGSFWQIDASKLEEWKPSVPLLTQNDHYYIKSHLAKEQTQKNSLKESSEFHSGRKGKYRFMKYVENKASFIHEVKHDILHQDNDHGESAVDSSNVSCPYNRLILYLYMYVY